MTPYGSPVTRFTENEVHGEGNHVRRDFRRPVTDPVQRVLHRVAEQVLHLGAEAVRRIVYQVLSRLLHGFDSVGNHASGLSDHLRRLFQHDGHAPGYDAGQEPQHQQDADQHADAAFDFQFVLRKTDDRLQRGCQRNCDNERRQLVPDLRDSPEKEHNQDDCTHSFQSQPLRSFSLFAHTLPRICPESFYWFMYFTLFSGSFQLSLLCACLSDIIQLSGSGSYFSADEGVFEWLFLF